MDNLTQHLLLHQNNPAKVREYKVELPEFPLWWLAKSKRNLEGLRDIASHLHDKTAALRTSRAGFVGEASEMEKQIVRNVTDLEQQVNAMTDAIQSALQIIIEDHWRRTHKAERFFAWIRESSKRSERKLSDNAFYKILAIASTLAALIGLAKWLAPFAKTLIHFFIAS
jgi:hypothetical protein